MIWTSDLVARVLGTDPGPAMATYGGVSTDSRTIEPGWLFLALAGERFDGHDFLEQARDRGAPAAVVRSGTASVEGLVFYEVEDTLEALGLLARERRRLVSGPVVAVTGTNGKTSTKEMLAAALRTRFRVHATKGNLNNLVGVPLTILSAPQAAEALVIEAGASVLGEIERLRRIAEPTLSLVTNVGAGHLEGFGSLDSVLNEKSALTRGVPIAIVGTDPPQLASRVRTLATRVVVAGLSPRADARPEEWGVDDRGYGWLEFKGHRLTLPLAGRHQVENAMLALATAIELGLDLEEVCAALTDVSLPEGRCDILSHGGHVVIQDTYNANPGSLMALLETARAVQGDSPVVVVLGTMLELGSDSPKLHEAMADAVMACAPHLVGVVGEFVPAFRRYAAELGDRLIMADDPADLGRQVKRRLAGNELILVKGSRGMHMERVMPHLLSNAEDACSTTS